MPEFAIMLYWPAPAEPADISPVELAAHLEFTRLIAPVAPGSAVGIVR